MGSEKMEAAKAAAEAARQKFREQHEEIARKRRERDARAANLGGAPTTSKIGMAIGRLEKVWREEYEAAFPGLVIPKWGGKANAKAIGQVKTLLELYGETATADAFRYICRNWEPISAKMFKGKGGPSPGLGLLVKLHEMVFAEAQTWAKHAESLAEAKAWWGDNPDAISLPEGLKQRSDEANKALKGLGLL